MKKIQMLLALAFMVCAAKAATPADSSKTVNGKSYVLHTVTKGETLYGLAGKYKTTVAELKKANNNLETLKAGQNVWVPGKAVVTSLVGSAQKKHTVVSGESLSKIARKYSTDVATLQKLNNLKSTDIKVGQVLIIPGAAGSAAPVAVKEESKEVKQEMKKEEKKAEEKAEKETPKDPVKPVVKAEDGSSSPASSNATIDRVGEIEEKGLVKIDIDSDMDQTRCFIKHPTIPKGNIIVVINPESGKMAYCRVVDNYEAKKGDTVHAFITQAVAQKIGLGASSGQVTLKYATP